MGEKYSPVKGDRVRVVLEGEVTQANEYDPWFNLEGKPLYSEGSAIVSVERIEPPVIVFKPGDVVQDKTNPRWKYAIGKKGYTQLSDGSYFADGEPFIQNEFTSKGYELVSLG